jgi:ABC-type branched-subunit amino acid transport system substrate-binding protein
VKKLLSLLLVLCLATLCFVGCDTGAADSMSGEVSDLPPYSFAMLTHLTGANAYVGTEFANGANLAVEHFGDTINGRRIELIVADGPDQDITISEFERLYDNGIRFFLSAGSNYGDRTFFTQVDEMKALFLTTAWAPDLISGPSDYFFRTAPSAATFGAANVDSAIYLAEKYLDVTASELKLAVAYDTNYAYLAEALRDNAETLGVEIAFYEGFSADMQDFVPLITQMQNTDYHILIPCANAASGTPFMKKMNEMGYVPPVIMGSGVYFDQPVFADLGDEITNGVLTESFITPAIPEDIAPGVTRFRDDYTAKYGHAPMTHALLGYTQTMLVYRILEAVDPAEWEDTAKLAEVTKNLDIDYGELPWHWGVKFENNENTRNKKFLICQWMDGEQKIVGPEELASAEAVIPWVR